MSIILISDYVLITIGCYFIAILNIFCDMIRYLDNSNLSNVREYLIYMYKYHCGILEKFELFSEVYYHTFTAQIATSVILILPIFFLLGSEDAVAYIPLSLVVFGQFGAICIFGELIFLKTEKFSTQLYLTKWYEFNTDDQKMLLMTMCMTQRPFGLKAGGMYDINFYMFIYVVKMSFSFGAILYTFT